MSDSVLVYKGSELASYGFGDPHPFGFDRHDVFQNELVAAGLDDKVEFGRPRRASVDDLLLWHLLWHMPHQHLSSLFDITE